ncbi:MAG: hypothetical protein GX075_10525 [Firmicutes bacterium]|nr:hypothetical protein [Bacillota bacterium]
MKKLLIFLLLINCLLASLVPAFAEQNYNDWIGKEIIFLPMTESMQKYGYQLYSYTFGGFGPIPYTDLANKSARIVELKQDTGILYITFKTEDGKIVYGQGYGGNLESIAFKSEMENVKQYIGKTIWTKVDLGTSPYILDTVTNKPKNIRLPNLAGYVIQNIEWGHNETWPLKFTLVSTTNDIVLWEGSYSRINDTSNKLMRPLEEYWYLSDPVKIYPKWPQRAWDAIKEYKIYIGMNKEMVLMSWGKPERVYRTTTANRVSEQWVYGSSNYVYFDNGVVSAIQN